MLRAAAIVAVELVLLLFLIDWPTRIIRPETEAADLARHIAASPGLTFGGLMTYPKARSEDATEAFLAATIAKLAESGIACPIVFNSTFALTPEDKIKEKLAVTSRCMPFEQEQIADTCVCCGKPAKKMVYWGRAY